MGSRFAVGLILLWASGFLLYISFHAGGVDFNGKPLETPDDVGKFFLAQAGSFFGKVKGSG